MAIDVGRVFCEYKLVDGSPASGTVWIQPVNFYDDGTTVIVPGKLPFPVEEGVLDADVVFDNADITPDLYLQIDERINGVASREGYLIKPEGAETNLATATRYELGPISEVGEPGQGPPGTAATIAVGSTTTGAPGTNASVVNVGTSSAATFNFTIPRGATGVQGLPGLDGSDGAQGEPGADGQDTNFLWVDVVTGDEVRPAIAKVLWVGGTVQPTNMAVGDVWLKALP